MPFVNHHANGPERTTHLLDQWHAANKELDEISTNGGEVTKEEQKVIDRIASLQRQLLGKPDKQD